MTKHLAQIISVVSLLFLFLAGDLLAQDGSDGNDPANPAGDRPAEILSVISQEPYLLFNVNDGHVVRVRLRVLDREAHLVSDSGERGGELVEWDSSQVPPLNRLIWELFAWDGAGKLVHRLGGEIRLAETGEDPFVVTAFDVPGNYSIGGYLGVGTDTPARAVHIQGSNAVFRMDRDQDTAAFMLVRTDASGNPLKTFVVGANATASDQGEFVINDLANAVSGAGTRRMTIGSTGEVSFSGTVQAAGFVSTSGGTNNVLTSVAHDSSLSGSGTASSSLGVANGGVTPAKLSASGSTSGQVLTSDGSAVAWGTPSTSGGLTTVAHDSTLAGLGTAGSPLSIAGSAVTTDKLADNSVGPAKIMSPGVTAANIYDYSLTQAKLSVTGTASSGMALGTDGTNLVWQSEDAFLPFSESDGTAAGTDLFRLENTSEGRAIHAIAFSDTAVWGVSTSGQAVVGYSDSGDGVEGRTDASGKSGVWGRSTDGVGVTGSSTANDGVNGSSAGTEQSGVFGSNSASGGIGVTGRNTAMSNSGYLGGYDYGVKGVATLGPGVMGETSSTHPRNAGIFGRTTSTVTAGIRAEALGAGSEALSVEANNDTGGPASATGIYVLVYGSPSTAAAFNGSVVINGVLTTWGGEYKVQPHPGEAGNQLAFAGLAGGEQALYVRGSGQLVAGRAAIELPDYFTAAASEAGLTVHITPTGDCRGVFVVSRSVSRIELQESQGGESDAPFDYLVMGVRRGFEDHAVVQENEAFKPQFKISVEEYEALLAKPENISVHRLLIENGTLTPEGKLDLETARRLRWKLGPKTRAERLAN